MRRIAIIGAGISGLTLAQALSGGAGRRDVITVFDKGRGVGGRISTRREAGYRFDHGAPSFTVRTPAFRAWLAPFRAAGIVAEWRGPVVNLGGGRVIGARHSYEHRFVGVPGMNALALRLAEPLDLRCGIEVAPLDAGPAPYRLRSTGGEELGSFDLVISTAPAHQTAALFRAVAGDARLPAAEMKPHHALMVGLDRPWEESWVAARLQEGPLKAIFVDSSKPGRAVDRATLVAHTRSRWSREHEQTPAELLAPVLLHALRAALPCDIGEPGLARVHRWRSALVSRPSYCGPWVAPDGTLAATGDFAAASRIEEVCLSALDLADRLARGAT